MVAFFLHFFPFLFMYLFPFYAYRLLVCAFGCWSNAPVRRPDLFTEIEQLRRMGALFLSTFLSSFVPLFIFARVCALATIHSSTLLLYILSNQITSSFARPRSYSLNLLAVSVHRYVCIFAYERQELNYGGRGVSAFSSSLCLIPFLLPFSWGFSYWRRSLCFAMERACWGLATRRTTSKFLARLLFYSAPPPLSLTLRTSSLFLLTRTPADTNAGNDPVRMVHVFRVVGEIKNQGWPGI
jgi:hypothetical protein